MLILEWSAIVRSLTWKQFLYSTEKIIFQEGSFKVVLKKRFRKKWQSTKEKTQSNIVTNMRSEIIYLCTENYENMKHVWNV